MVEITRDLKQLRSFDQAADTATDWVGKHCDVKVSFPILVTPSCSLTRRDGEGVDSETQESLKATCRKIGQNPLVTDGGFSFELVKDIFEDTDSKGGADGVLDATEYTKFIETLEVFDYCMAL
ncbi:hypothetical protein V1264_007094 [Littorina saxatilis]|uniref:Uncharacterized protein n=1 Tax=Littorina saxatilis TaxID=31220 RepID=A0AAN9G2W4_9CAEN